MANWFFLMLLSLLYFNFWLTSYDWLSLSVMYETFQPASLAQECLFDNHLRSFSTYSDLIYSGMMRKVCYDRTFTSGWQLSVWLYFMSMCFSEMLYSLSYICICKWCLLIPMNNKDWYFFLWKKRFQYMLVKNSWNII